MRSTHVCPKCSGQRFVINQVRKSPVSPLPAVEWWEGETSTALGGLLRAETSVYQHAGTLAA
jgi:hypothetical protein